MPNKSLKLYHCRGSRSIRVLWTLKELDLNNYELITMPFPPRFAVKDYVKINPLGTVPYFIDTEAGVSMTESCAIPVYLCEKYGDDKTKGRLLVRPEEKDYGAYLNWLAYADATLTFPITLKMRYQFLEPHKGFQQVGVDYEKWHLARCRLLEAAFADGRAFLCHDRFTLADVCVGTGICIGHTMGIKYPPLIEKYMERMKARPAYRAALEEENKSFEDFEISGGHLKPKSAL